MLQSCPAHLQITDVLLTAFKQGNERTQFGFGIQVDFRHLPLLDNFTPCSERCPG